MKDFEAKKMAFLGEINQELAPVLEVVVRNENPQHTMTSFFDVQLCKTKYAMVTQVAVEDEMDALVNELSLKHFGMEPRFNNTHRCFWFTGN